MMTVIRVRGITPPPTAASTQLVGGCIRSQSLKKPNLALTLPPSLLVLALLLPPLFQPT